MRWSFRRCRWTRCAAGGDGATRGKKTNKKQSIPHLLNLLEKFGSFSGYKINLDKSLLFPVNKASITLTYDQFPFKVENQSFKYLGVNITRLFKTLIMENFNALLKQTKSILERWVSLPISLAGRVNALKMTILPRFLYLFQAIPVWLPKYFLITLDKYISTFIWNKSTPRMRKKLMERPKSEGGLGLPNLLHYNWAANISKLTYWVTTFSDKDGPSWAKMELYSHTTISPISFLTAPLPSCTRTKFFCNPVVANSIKIWTQFRRHFNFDQISSFSPLSLNHIFKPSQMDSSFEGWHRLGLVFFQDLFSEESFMSLESLFKKHNIPKSHFF